MSSENIFEQPVPDNVLERVHAFARDLAFGVANRYWDSKFKWKKLRDELNIGFNIVMTSQGYETLLDKQWGIKFPSASLLVSFGYLSIFNDNIDFPVCYLTEKAFKLLEKPTTPPNVFISYRRSDSSALALLIEARLKLAGNPNPFVDKSLVAGQEWNKALEDRVKAARYFVLIVGQTTLDSPYIKGELNWAEQYGATIISIWHGCKPDENAPKVLSSRHAIIVENESALGYETAINQLLNSLGYATY